MTSMLAARYEQGSGLRLERIPVPRIGPGEALLAVETASICATDVRIVKGAHQKYGQGTVRTPGHEIAGRVVQTGSGVTSVKAGQRVFVAPNIGCGECPACRRGKNNLCPDYEAFGITLDGGFAEYMRVTAEAIEQGNLFPIGEEVDAAEMTLAEPLACVLHGQEQVNVRAGDTVLIFGAGPIGLMHLLLAKARGASAVVIADLNAARLAAAARLGATRVVDAASGSFEGADVVIVATASAAALQQAVSAAAPGGRINFFAGLPKEASGVKLDCNLIHYRELWITGTTGCSTDDCRRAAELVLARKLDLKALISARFPLAAMDQALEAAKSPSHLKIVMTINEHAQDAV